MLSCLLHESGDCDEKDSGEEVYAVTWEDVFGVEEGALHLEEVGAAVPLYPPLGRMGSGKGVKTNRPQIRMTRSRVGPAGWSMSDQEPVARLLVTLN